MHDADVTLVLYNSADHLKACIDSLRPDVARGTIRVTAVDNSSPDESAELLQRELPEAEIIRSEVNRGFAGGCNLAWPARGRYWVLVNPDVVVDDTTITALVAWMDHHPDVGLASPWLRPDADAAATPGYPGRPFPSISRALLEFSRLHRLLPAARRAAWLQGPYIRVANGPVPEPEWVPGALVIARTQAVHEVGPLDDRIFLYGEDIEWCWRIRKGGWRVAAPRIGGGVHHASASSRRTWNHDDDVVAERIVTGTLTAVRLMHGRPYASAYAAITQLILASESRHPRRSAAHRANAARYAHAWKAARKTSW